MKEILSRVEAALTSYLEPKTDPHVVADAMAYSTLGGGKRVRAFLVLTFCELCGGNMEQALPYACAIEMIHAYSLIHDDLPCMDNDDLRRGKPSCHKAFGEANALLAGDGLLTKAFFTVTLASLPAEKNLRAVQVLSQFAGVEGMILGQERDLSNQNKTISTKELIQTDQLKTSALLQASCLLGVIAGNGGNAEQEAAMSYGENMGLAFQIVDDILDVTGEEALLGKPVGSDAENQKSTYVSVLGLEEAKRSADMYTKKALDALTIFGDRGKALAQYTQSLLARNR